MMRLRIAAMTLALAGLSTGVTTAATSTAAGAAVPAVSTLTQIRAAHHPGYDRLVFQFSGRVPARHSASYVSRVIADPSGLPVPVVGSARLRVVFSPATGFNQQGHGTFGPARRTYALPELIQVAKAGDFEAVLSFGVGVARQEPFHMFTLTNPSRVVIDVATPFRTVGVRDYFANRSLNLAAVSRPVIPPAVATGALQRLFAGPTQAELARGLRFVSSGATGFRIMSIRDRIARVQLTGNVRSGGAAFTIANELMPTLKQFSTVRWVKIYDQHGHTERPNGYCDSIPFSLEP